VAAHRAVLVDNRIIPTQVPDQRWLKQNGLDWLASGDNSDYLANRVVAIAEKEMQAFHAAVKDLYKMQLEAARHVADKCLWEAVGVPKEAIPLVEYSLRNEEHLHLIGRYDFAGGIDGLPIKLLEFNADTFSLLPETVRIQPQITAALQPGRNQPPSYRTFEHLVAAFEQLLRRYPDFEPTILFSSMGYEEDGLNLQVMQDAAKQAGFQVVRQVHLERVVFSEDEGIFIELGPDRFQRFDFWVKMVPWDFICYDEPDLLDLLDNIIRGKHAVVINPAMSMLLQSKGLLPIMAQLFPQHPLVLPASFEEGDFEDKKAYAAKPIFGRMGENISLWDAEGECIIENDGDYGDFPYIYQELAELNADGRGYTYQPSVYWVQQPSGICVRRQEGPAIDDDAEFVSHIIE
jgi:glutathionylspermidine synthase